MPHANPRSHQASALKPPDHISMSGLSQTSTQSLAGTKIVATLGPACHDVPMLVDLLTAGVVGGWSLSLSLSQAPFVSHLGPESQQVSVG